MNDELARSLNQLIEMYGYFEVQRQLESAQMRLLSLPGHNPGPPIIPSWDKS